MKVRTFVITTCSSMSSRADLAMTDDVAQRARKIG